MSSFEKGSPSRGSRVALRFVALAFAIALLGFGLRNVEWTRTFALIERIGWGALLIPLPYLFGSLLDASGWRRIIAAVGGMEGALRLRSVLAIHLCGDAILMSLVGGPLVAEGVRPYLLARRHGIPFSRGVASVAARKRLMVLSNGTYLLLALIGGFALLERLSPEVIGVGGLPWLVLGFGLAMLSSGAIAGLVLARGRLTARLHALLDRVRFAPLQRWLGRHEGAFFDTDRALVEAMTRAPRDSLLAGVLLLGMWLLESVETFAILRLLGVTIGFTEAMAFETVLSTVRSLVFVVPSGLGVQDLGYVAFLRALGVPEAFEVGAAFVILKRAKELFYIATGYVVLFVLGGGPALRAAPAEGG